MSAQMREISNLIELCRQNCPKGIRPSAEEAMVLIGEIDRQSARIAEFLEALKAIEETLERDDLSRPERITHALEIARKTGSA